MSLCVVDLPCFEWSMSGLANRFICSVQNMSFSSRQRIKFARFFRVQRERERVCGVSEAKRPAPEFYTGNSKVWMLEIFSVYNFGVILLGKGIKIS